jgi:beta-galactosidase
MDISCSCFAEAQTGDRMHRSSFNDGWFVHASAGRFGDLFGAAPERTPVVLPHDAMIGRSRSPSAGAANAFFPGGNWEYRRFLDPRAVDADSVVVLEFEGVYREAVVLVNGTIATRRPYGYSNFFVRIDPLLRLDAENEIRVEARAGDDTRWYSGAGIYRNVSLLSAPRVHLAPQGLDVRTPEIDDRSATVTVAAVVQNQSPSACTGTLRVEVREAGGTVVARADAPVTTFPGDSITTRTRLAVPSPRRWRVEDPYLYSCDVSLRTGDALLDEDTTTFGIRSLALDAERGLRINGEPVLLRGACVHHDNGVLGAATIARAEERRVELLKAAGFNAIRSAHNPMSRAMLDACDRLGMLVMDETFDMWTQTKSEDDYALRFGDWWERDVEAMVRKDVSHPCVIMYSIGNEIPNGSTPTGIQIARALAAKVRSLDDTRFVTQAVTGFFVGGSELFDEIRGTAEATGTDENTEVNTAAVNLGDVMVDLMRSTVVTDKTSEAFSFLDVAGYNYMATRFDMDRELFPQRVIVATESQPPSVDKDWAGVLRNPNVIGDFTWTGWDYLGEAGIGRIEYGDAPGAFGMTGFHGEYPWLTAWCGDIDIAGYRRPQSYYREIVFDLRDEPYIAVLRPHHQGRAVTHASPWAWPDVVSSWTWPGHEGDPVTVEVYADADEVELLLDGRSLGRQPAGADSRYRAQFEVTYEPGVLEAVASRDGKEVGRSVLRTATGPVHLDVTVDRAEIAADPSDLAYITLELVDDAGALDTSSDRRVAVAVDGPGVLQGLGSAKPINNESFTTSECTTFDGRALAVVRPTGAGTITVTVTADDCAPKTARIDARE